MDLNHGYVGYNTTIRFGYKDFIEAFVSLINAGEEAIGSDYRYNISLCTSGLSLDDIKKELHSIGKIKELRIRMQPPNPSEQLLDRLKERSDGIVQSMGDANVTGAELYYTTTGSSGINISAPFINEKIDDTQSLYSALPVEESTKKGYVTIEATSTNGRKYSSGESKPVKRVILGIEEFLAACKDAFHQL